MAVRFWLNSTPPSALKCVLPAVTVIDVSCGALANAPPSIDVTLLGIASDVRLGVSANALPPIDVTLLGIAKPDMPEPSKAKSPIVCRALVGAKSMVLSALMF